MGTLICQEGLVSCCSSGRKMGQDMYSKDGQNDRLGVAGIGIQTGEELIRQEGFILNILVDMHCKENPIYVFLFWELRGFRPNFHIHEAGSD